MKLLITFLLTLSACSDNNSLVETKEEKNPIFIQNEPQLAKGKSLTQEEAFFLFGTSLNSLRGMKAGDTWNSYTEKAALFEIDGKKIDCKELAVYRHVIVQVDGSEFRELRELTNRQVNRQGCQSQNRVLKEIVIKNLDKEFDSSADSLNSIKGLKLSSGLVGKRTYLRFEGLTQRDNFNQEILVRGHFDLSRILPANPAYLFQGTGNRSFSEVTTQSKVSKTDLDTINLDGVRVRVKIYSK